MPARTRSEVPTLFRLVCEEAYQVDNGIKTEGEFATAMRSWFTGQSNERILEFCTSLLSFVPSSEFLD